jgi:hypothetical protein
LESTAKAERAQAAREGVRKDSACLNVRAGKGSSCRRKMRYQQPSLVTRKIHGRNETFCESASNEWVEDKSALQKDVGARSDRDGMVCYYVIFVIEFEWFDQAIHSHSQSQHYVHPQLFVTVV